MNRSRRHVRSLALIAFVAVQAEVRDARAADAAPTEPSVEVRGALIRHVTSDPFAASTVVRGVELEAVGQSSADVLARVPGVAVARTGSQSDLATASIRGSDSTQVPVYVSGIRINDDVSGTADLSTVPLWMMDRVEIFRGNAPANGDQLGIGGAIYFWPRLPKTTRVGGGAQVGSFGARGGFVAGEVGNDTAGALVAVRRDQADNDYEYLNDDGKQLVPDEHVERRKNADFVAYDAWAIGRYKLSRTDNVSTVINAYDREQGVTGAGVAAAEHSRATTRRLLSGVSGRFGCPGARDTCRVEVQGSLLTARLTYQDPLNELQAIGAPLLTNAGERAVLRAAIAVDPSDVVSLGGGITESVEAIRIDAVGLLPKDGHRSSTHLTVNATVTPVTPLRIYALAALDCHTTSGLDDQFGVAVARDSGTCGTLAPAARLGASYRVSSGVELVGNAGRYVRMPTLTELYGSSALVQGNAALRPEVGETVDVGVRANASGAAGRYAADAFVFSRWAEDLIRYQGTSFGATGPYNVGSGRIAGAEATLSGEWLDALRAQLATTFMDPRNLDAQAGTNGILTYTPRFVGSLRLEAFATRGLTFLRQSSATLALVYLHRASRYDDRAGQVVLPEQNLVDLEATSAHFGGKVVARVAVRNILDSYQYDLLGLPLPRRSMYASIEAWW